MRTRKPRPDPASLVPVLLLPLLLVAALLAGCSDDPDAATDAAEEPLASAEPTGEETASEAAGPACSDVWGDGETLPGGYRGCVEDGTDVKPESRPCSFGKPLLTQGGRFWAVRGGRITETDQADLLDDQRYRKVLALCTG